MGVICLCLRTRRRSGAFLVGLALGALLCLGASVAPAAVGGVGYDVSYPQCPSPLPSGEAFGLVGVDGGLANNANPCLGSELGWAGASPGLKRPRQPALSLYVNTANPGAGVADWPRPPAGSSSGSTPFGRCDGSDSRACAFLYGQQRASFSYALAAFAGAPTRSVAWWLDIETGSTWATPTGTRAWAALNQVTIRGFAAGLRDAGARGSIGFYSSPAHWRAITGLTPRASRTVFPAAFPDWVAGAGTLARARMRCGTGFSGAAVRLVQFADRGYDGDWACPSIPRARRPASRHRRR